MHHAFKLSLAGALAVVAATAAPLPAAAQSTDYLISQLQRSTPNCRQNPDYGWQGRVSGQREVNSASRPISFAGCFPTEQECETWRKSALPFVTGRIIYNACTPRK